MRIIEINIFFTKFSVEIDTGRMIDCHCEEEQSSDMAISSLTIAPLAMTDLNKRSDNMVGFLVGLIVGGIFGVIVMAMMHMASQSDDRTK